MKKDHLSSIKKWPFYMGDALLVCLGLTIFFLAGPQNAWAIIASVISVTCGAVIFIVPYILEYKQNFKINLANNPEIQTNSLELKEVVHEISDLNEERAIQIEKQKEILKEFNNLVQKTGEQLELLAEKTDESESDVVIDFDEESDPEVDIELDMDEDFLDEDNGGETTSDEQIQDPIEVMVIANIQMGIGGKLFIRGDGGGLNWDKGMPMTYESLGKWQWISNPIIEPIKYRIYKNDEIPENTEARIIEPGQEEEIHPEFE